MATLRMKYGGISSEVMAYEPGKAHNLTVLFIVVYFVFYSPLYIHSD